MTGERPTIFFDLDGTLTDPKEGITRSIQYSLKRLGFPVPEIDELTWCIGPPLQESFATMVGPENVDRGIEVFRERFADIGWRENYPYKGVVEMLSQLQQDGYPLHVATSKPLVYADQIIKHFDLAPFFLNVFGSELDGTLSNKRELLSYAKSEVGLVGSGIMVGDRSHDMIGAVGNQLSGIGVTYGYGSASELNEAGAMRLANHPKEIVDCVYQLTKIGR